MKSILIAVLANTIIASSLAAQVPPKLDTFTVKMPPRPTPRADTNAVKVIRGRERAPTPDDSLIMRAVPDSGGRGEWLTQVGDTVWVVGATMHSRTERVDTLGHVVGSKTTIIADHWEARVERRKGKWVQVSRRKL